MNSCYRSMKVSLSAFNEDHDASRNSKTSSENMRKYSHNFFYCMEEKKAMASKGAQKLDQMGDSWSMGPDFDGLSRNIAKDLLQGALHLQKSLFMLGKLQEAPKYMARSKQKQKLNIKEDDDIEVEEMDSQIFQYNNYEKQLQALQLSVDGSSRSCNEELKKVISDSLCRQNLLSTPSHEERTSSNRWSFDWLSDGPSASASQLFKVHSYSGLQSLPYGRHARTDDRLVSASPQQKKAKSPNLIAKLMGLEEVPSESVQSSGKELVSKNSRHSRRQVFEIDMPKARKPKFADKKADSKRRTLEEIIDAMQMKGILKCDDVKLHSHALGSSRSDRHDMSVHMERLGDEIPPIVIIKPLLVPSSGEEIQTGRLNQEDEGTSGHKPILEGSGANKWEMETRLFQREVVSDRKQMPEKLKANEPNNMGSAVKEEGMPEPKHGAQRSGVKQQKSSEPTVLHKEVSDPQQIIKISAVGGVKNSETTALHKDGVSQSKKTMRRMTANAPKTMETTTRARIPDPKQVVKKLGAKEQMITESKVGKETVSACKQIPKTAGVKERLISETSVHKGDSDPKELVKKSGAKELNSMKTTEKPTNQVNVLASLNHKHQKSETIKTGKKSDDAQKALPDRRKSGKETMNSVAEPESQSKIASKKPMKPEKKVLTTKNLNLLKKNTSQVHSTSSTKRPVSCNSVNQLTEGQIKKSQPARRCLDTSSFSSKAESKQDIEGIDLAHEMKAVSATVGTLPEKQIPTQTGKDSEVLIKEQNRGNREVVRNVLQITIVSEPTKVCNMMADCKTSKAKNDLKQLLSSSPSLLNHVEELFHLNTNYPHIGFQASNVETEMENARLILDSADEFMARKSRQMEHVGRAIQQVHTWNRQTKMTLDCLMEELIDGIESLRCYGKVAGNVLTEDGLYRMLGEDLNGKGGVVNGVWDLGWVNGFPNEEVDQIVAEVLKNVLNELIDEVITYFV